MPIYYSLFFYENLIYDSVCTMTSKMVNAASVTPKVVIMIPLVAGKYPFVMALYVKDSYEWLWPCHMVIHRTSQLITCAWKKRVQPSARYRAPINMNPTPRSWPIRWMAVSCNRNNCVIPVEQQQTTNNSGRRQWIRAHACYIMLWFHKYLPTPTEMVEKLVRIHARNVRSLAMKSCLHVKKRSCMWLLLCLYKNLPKWSLATAPVFSRYRDPSVIDFRFCTSLFNKLVDSVADMGYG